MARLVVDKTDQMSIRGLSSIRRPARRSAISTTTKSLTTVRFKRLSKDQSRWRFNRQAIAFFGPKFWRPPRPQGQSSCQRDTLLLSSGEFARPHVQIIAKPDKVCDVGDVPPAFSGPDTLGREVQTRCCRQRSYGAKAQGPGTPSRCRATAAPSEFAEPSKRPFRQYESRRHRAQPARR